ncbi:MAG: UDP-N-acetylmuramate dehydrogenase [bacterium]
MEVRGNVLLASLTTVGLGGRAQYFASCSTVEDLKEALLFAREKNLAVHILGGGSNTIFADKGFAGLVIKVELKGMKFIKDGLVEAAAGEEWDNVVEECVKRGLAGLECLSGVPGSVGAAPVQNVGAYGQQAADVVDEVEILDRQTLGEVLFSSKQCQFGYRYSRFKGKDSGRYIVTKVTFRLRPGGESVVQYPELVKRLGEKATLEKVREVVLELRKEKALMAESGLQSCGSFFINPIIPRDKLSRLQKDYEVPHFEAGNDVKVSAAWLVEQAGYKKGFRRDNVGISPKHALALVNYGGTAEELLVLAEDIQAAVKKKFGIELEREPVVVSSV